MKMKLNIKGKENLFKTLQNGAKFYDNGVEIEQQGFILSYRNNKLSIALLMKHNANGVEILRWCDIKSADKDAGIIEIYSEDESRMSFQDLKNKGIVKVMELKGEIQVGAQEAIASAKAGAYEALVNKAMSIIDTAMMKDDIFDDTEPQCLEEFENFAEKANEAEAKQRGQRREECLIEEVNPMTVEELESMMNQKEDEECNICEVGINCGDCGIQTQMQPEVGIPTIEQSMPCSFPPHSEQNKGNLRSHILTPEQEKEFIEAFKLMIDGDQ